MPDQTFALPAGWPVALLGGKVGRLGRGGSVENKDVKYMDAAPLTEAVERALFGHLMIGIVIGGFVSSVCWLAVLWGAA
jgi:hypothetical protein